MPRCRHLGALIALPLVVCAVGCSRAYYRQSADDETYAILAEKANDPRWALPDLDITPDPCSRFYDQYDPDEPPLPPDDPTAGEVMKCVDGKRGWSHWNEFGRIDHVENPNWPEAFREREALDTGHVDTRTVSDASQEEPIVQFDSPLPRIERLSLADAVEIGLIHSRDYQEQLENVYLNALALTYQRYRFDIRPTAWLGEPGTGVFYNHQPDDASSLELGASNLGFSKLLPTGAQFMAEMTNNTLWLFSGSNGSGSATTFAYSLVQPLLAGAGRQIVLENLTQAERNSLYSVRDFARFRRSFFVTIVTGERAIPLPGNSGQGELAFLIRGERSPTVGFYHLLHLYQLLRNHASNVRSLAGQHRDLIELHREGHATVLDVTQLQTSLEEARTMKLYSERRFGDELDRFKVQLGLPPDMEVQIDDSLLEPFQFQSDEIKTLQDEIRQLGTQVELLRKDITSQQMGQCIDALLPLEQKLEAAFVAAESRIQRLADVLPARSQRMAPEEIAEFRESVQRDTNRFGELREAFNRTQGRAAAVRQLFTANANAESRQAALIDDIDAVRRELAQAARRLSGLETAVRVELITLPPVKVLPEETIRLALENRVDLMNRRGFVMDARRRFEVAADRLEATLDLVAEGEVKTPPVSENSQPFDFRAKQSEFRVGVTLTTPLDRRAQRNDFRAAQISYQRARRNYMTAEDQVKLDVRQQLRHVHAQGAVFEIQRRMLRVAARELEQAVEAGEQTVENGNTGGLQGMTIPRALDNMLDAQNALIDTWVDYETARLCLFRDMGTMQIDESGIWGEAQTVERRK